MSFSCFPHKDTPRALSHTPGFSGAREHLKEAEACQHHYCENAFTHWTHKFTALTFWKKSGNAEHKILKMISACKRLPQDGAGRVQGLKAILLHVYTSLTKECLSVDHDEDWHASGGLKEELDKVGSSVSYTHAHARTHIDART